MKSYVQIPLYFLFSLCLAFKVNAQDIIIKKNGDKVKAKILEINDTQVRYNEFRDINNLVFTLDRALIKEIRFETGTKYKEEQPGLEDGYFAEDRINNLKLNFGAIGGGNIILTFERAIAASSSWESTVKFYGLGTADQYSKESGFGLNVGYKMKTGNLFKKSGEYRPKHILHGGYFRPVLGFSYKKEEYDYDFGDKATSTSSYVHFGLDLGTQFIIQNSLSLDLYVGFHYLGGSFTYKDSFSDRQSTSGYIQDGDLFGDNSRAISFGFRVGGLFTKRGITKKKK